MRDERAVSVGLNYVLALGISAILISGLLVGLGGFLESQQEQTARTELEVIGEQLVGDIAAADRLVLANDGTPTVELRRSLPPTVVGSTYSIEVVVSAPNAPYLELSANRLDVTVRVPFALSTLPNPGPSDPDPDPTVRLAESTVSGGDVVISYTGGQLVVDHA
jgi:hypothetical protein